MFDKMKEEPKEKAIAGSWVSLFEEKSKETLCISLKELQTKEEVVDPSFDPIIKIVVA